jgi:hypothetical protein
MQTSSPTTRQPSHDSEHPQSGAGDLRFPSDNDAQPPLNQVSSHGRAVLQQQYLLDHLEQDLSSRLAAQSLVVEMTQTDLQQVRNQVKCVESALECMSSQEPGHIGALSERIDAIESTMQSQVSCTRTIQDSLKGLWEIVDVQQQRHEEVLEKHLRMCNLFWVGCIGVAVFVRAWMGVGG